jgi:hypothetical protein
MNITESTRVVDLNVGQLIDIMTNLKKQEAPVKVSNFCNDDFIFGDKGLSEFLKCSIVTIYNRKKAGIYDSAIIRNGRKIIYKKSEIEKILEINKAQ